MASSERLCFAPPFDCAYTLQEVTPPAASTTLQQTALGIAKQRAAEAGESIGMIAERFDSTSTGTDFSTTLPYRSVLTFRLYSILEHFSDQPALTLDAADCPPDGPPTALPGCRVGPPVAGAEVRFSIAYAEDRLEGQSDPVEVTTDAHGVARVTVISGKHPGQIRVRAVVQSNPVNPWLLPHRSFEIIVHPHASEDAPLSATGRPKLIPMASRTP